MSEMFFWLQKVLSSEHFLGNRMLEVKVATPKVALSLSLSLSIYLSIYLLIYSSIYLSIYLSMYIYIYICFINFKLSKLNRLSLQTFLLLSPLSFKFCFFWFLWAGGDDASSH